MSYSIPRMNKKITPYTILIVRQNYEVIQFPLFFKIMNALLSRRNFPVSKLFAEEIVNNSITL